MESLKRMWHGLARALKIMGDSSLRSEAQELFERMRKDGVDPVDANARQAWIRAHREDLRHLQGKEPSSSVVCAETKTGRNDSCPCGSGRKYKKCCGGLS